MAFWNVRVELMMNGASGDVLSAIHLTPEAADGGPIACLRDGDRIRIDARTCELTVLVAPDAWNARVPVVADLTQSHYGTGRELFSNFRRTVSAADKGASIFEPLPVPTQRGATFNILQEQLVTR